MLQRLIRNAKKHFSDTGELRSGVYHARNITFYFGLLCYLLSFLVFADDPFFWVSDTFRFSQTFMPILFAVIFVSCINWELMLFGKPAGLNLFLQCCQIFPFSLLFARLTGVPTAAQEQMPSILGRIFDGTGSVARYLTGLEVPQALKDLFANPAMLLLLCLFLFALSFRKAAYKIGGSIFLLLAMFACTIAAYPSRQLAVGTLLLIAGLASQFSRYDRNVFAIRVEQNLFRYGPIDRMLCRTIRAIMVQLSERGSKVSESQMFQIVKDVYGEGEVFSGNDLKLITVEIARKMTYTYNLIRIDMSSEGKFVTANPLLYCTDHLLMSVAVVPRIVFAVLMTALWVLSPVDLIPDAVPFIGAVDDFIVTCLSGIVVERSCKLLK